jgi:hypothetical protein
LADPNQTGCHGERHGESKFWKLLPNLLIEFLYSKNDSNEEEAWLSPDDAVKLGLTPGSRMYRRATGELLPEE